MRPKAEAFVVVLLVWAAGAVAAEANLEAPGGGPIRVEEQPGERITVTTNYWRLGFDLQSGGALDTIVFPHASGRNVLVRPFRIYVNDWEAAYTPKLEVRRREQGGLVRLSFAGRLASSGRTAAPVEFETSWVLSPFVARVDYKLRFLEDVAAARVGVGSTAVRRELDEWGLRVGLTDDPDRRKMAPASFGRAVRSGEVLFREHHAPIYVLLFDRAVEGFDITMGSDLATWESGLTGRGGAGWYEARVAREAIELVVEPLSVPQPLRVVRGEHTFRYWLGLPRIVEKADRRWRHLMFHNHPWPSDNDVKVWAESGVNIVRLHNDYADDGNFWRDGAWPPYDEAGMTEMRRVIAACRRHNIRVAPYFSIHEFHPEAQGYAGNESRWARTVDQAGTVFHNLIGKGEFGAQMCPQSGWLDRRKHDVEQAYRELGFDGIYYDWVMTLACTNKHHNPNLHLGTDGVIDMLAWTRRLLGDKGTLILHLYGKMPSIAFENFADLVVNMEEISGAEKLMELDEVPVVTVLAESIMRSPCPSYRKDMAVERNRRNIAHMVVLGMFPWALGPGNGVYEETLKLFRAFQPYRLEQYRLRDVYSGAVRTSWEDVYGALYASPERALVVISNASPERRRNVVWRVHPAELGLQAARLAIRDVKTGATRQVPAAALTDGSLLTELDGYEYRLFEISPAP
jgi:hypothetical protein